MQGGTRNCSSDANLQESIDNLSTQFEAALTDALASGLITPPAEVPSVPLKACKTVAVHAALVSHPSPTLSSS